jgi:hypothetical protein
MIARHSSIQLLLIVVLVLLAELRFVAEAYPEGAPNCQLGRASPESLHLSATKYQTGPISDYDLDLIIGNRTIDAKSGAAAINNFTMGMAHPVSLRYRNASFFRESWKGVLLILNDANFIDVSTGLMPMAPYIVASGCGGGFGNVISGVTHADRTLKDRTKPIATLRVDVVSSGLLMDVNVVIANNGTYSIYFHSQFALSSVAPPVTPTTTNNSTKRPTARPVTPRPTARPTAQPTLKPTTQPMVKPVVSPVTAPIATAPVPQQQPQQQQLPTKYTFAPVYVSPMPPLSAPVAAPTKRCGILGLGILCRRKCAWRKRFLGECD